jgi:integrase
MAELKKETNIDVKNIILIAIYTGMRRSEIFKLKWEDVSFERKTISLKNPKSGIDKIIPLNDLASDVFSNCIRYQSEYIFPASRGGGHRKSVSRAAKRIMRAAGVPDDFRPMHGLRHFFGTSLICNGVDIPTLQKLMTHSSPQMTLRYAKIRDEKLADASNRLVDIFGKK